MPLQAVRHFETLWRLVDSSRQEPQVPGHRPRRSDRGQQDGGDPVSGAGRPLLHGDPRHHWRGEWGWRSGYTASPWDGVETFLGKSEVEYSVFFGLRAWTLPRLFWVQGILLSSHVLIIASTIQQSVQLIPLLSFHAPCANEVNIYFYKLSYPSQE